MRELANWVIAATTAAAMIAIIAILSTTSLPELKFFKQNLARMSKNSVQ
jgi:hypothetical protein